MEDNARIVGHIWIPMSGATAMSSRRIRNKKSAGAKICVGASPHRNGEDDNGIISHCF
jgi:hypothetical protein